MSKLLFLRSGIRSEFHKTKSKIDQRVELEVDFFTFQVTSDILAHWSDSTGANAKNISGLLV